MHHRRQSRGTQPPGYFVLVLLFVCLQTASGQTGVRGDPDAIAEAEAMVESMGGREIWAQLGSIHFRHEWHIWNWPDAYIEDEILDLTGPRSWVEMKSEIYHRVRAYSPENGYWNVVNGEFSYADDQALASAMERAPFSLYRIARGIAAGDPYYEVRSGPGRFTGSRRLEFYGPDGVLHGWIVLNFRKEPVLWATTQYEYMFGPLRPFGNLRVPDWAVTGNGAVTYEMLSLSADTHPPDPALFAPPEEVESRDPASGSRN